MKSFNELGIEANIIKAIEELGFNEPMPVQEEVIPHLLDDIYKRYYCTSTNRNRKNRCFWHSPYSKSVMVNQNMLDI